MGDELPPEVGYRAKVFSMIPSLLYLDQEDIDGNVEEEEEEHVNGNGLAEEDDDLDDGDDELEHTPIFHKTPNQRWQHLSHCKWDACIEH